MILLRLVGRILLLAGLAVLLRDLLVWIDTGHYLPLALGAVPGQLDPWAALRWPAAAAPFATLWAWPVALVPAVLLLLVGRRRWRRR